MELDDKMRAIIDQVDGGAFNSLAGELDDTDLGIYVPAFTDGKAVRLMPEGMSQLESNLKILYKKKLPGIPAEGQPVGWFGSLTGKDSKCRHGGTESCTHCTDHSGGCKHCTSHEKGIGPDIGLSFPDLDAPELNYDHAVQKVREKSHILEQLAASGLGLALIHGHSDKYKFTQLPRDKVAVVANGTTTFRTLEDVRNDKTFVPNIWRFVDGALQPAGGYSDN